MPQSGISMKAKNSIVSFIEDKIPLISNFNDANATLIQLHVIKSRAINMINLVFLTASLRKEHMQSIPKKKKYIFERSIN